MQCNEAVICQIVYGISDIKRVHFVKKKKKKVIFIKLET